MAIIVTGSAGFIGYHVSLALLDRGERVLGIDDLNAYYDPALKRARLERLRADPGFAFAELDVESVHVPLRGTYHQVAWDHTRLPGLVRARQIRRLMRTFGRCQGDRPARFLVGEFRKVRDWCPRGRDADGPSDS